MQLVTAVRVFPPFRRSRRALITRNSFPSHRIDASARSVGWRPLARAARLGVVLIVAIEAAYLVTADLVFPGLLEDLAKARGFELRVERPLSLYPGQLKLKRVEVRAPPDTSGTLKRAVAQDVVARFRPLDLLRRGELNVVSAQAREILVELASGPAEGRPRGQGVTGPALQRQGAFTLASHSAPSFRLSIDQLKTADGAIVWNEYRLDGGLAIELRGLRLERGSAHVQGVELSLRGAEVTAGGRTVVSDLRGRGAYGPEQQNGFVRTTAAVQLLTPNGDTATLASGSLLTLDRAGERWELSASVPELTSSGPAGLSLVVRGLDARLEAEVTRPAWTELDARAAEIGVTAGGVRVAGSASLEFELAAPRSNAQVELTGGTIELHDLVVERLGSSRLAGSPHANLTVEHAVLGPDASKLTGRLSVSGTDVGAALGLLAPPNRRLAFSDLLRARPFAMEAWLRHSPLDTRFDGVRITSDGFGGRGALRFDTDGAHGALLFRHGGLSLGVVVEPSGSSFVLGAGDTWLRRQLATLER